MSSGSTRRLDYKSEDIGSSLDRLCPDGIDINFANVGGRIMDAVFALLRSRSRMSVCGMISQYNDEGPLQGPTDFGRVLMKRLTIRGFVVIDYLPRAREALAGLSAWIMEDRIRWRDHVIEGGLAAAPETMMRLFRGDHFGKLILRVSSHA